jgi:hypothetical protein
MDVKTQILLMVAILVSTVGANAGSFGLMGVVEEKPFVVTQVSSNAVNLRPNIQSSFIVSILMGRNQIWKTIRTQQTIFSSQQIRVAAL